MDTALEFLQLAGPTVAGLLTVPTLQLAKKGVGLLDRAPAPVKQLTGVGIAFGLTKLGTALNVALPVSLELFTGSDVESLLSASIAFAVHAGQKARR